MNWEGTVWQGRFLRKLFLKSMIFRMWYTVCFDLLSPTSINNTCYVWHYVLAETATICAQGLKHNQFDTETLISNFEKNSLCYIQWREQDFFQGGQCEKNFPQSAVLKDGFWKFIAQSYQQSSLRGSDVPTRGKNHKRLLLRFLRKGIC